MSKYEIKKIDTDTFVLEYKDTKREFKRTVGIASKLQQHAEMAEANMILDLAKKGMTINDLRIEKYKDGKKYVDESSLEAVRKVYRDNAFSETFDDTCLELFGLKLADLTYDVGLSSSEESMTFAQRLMSYIVNGEDTQTPSKEQNQNN